MVPQAQHAVRDIAHDCTAQRLRPIRAFLECWTISRWGSHHLDIIVPQPQHPARDLSHDGKGLRQQVVQRGPPAQAPPELSSLGLQGLQGQVLHGWLQSVDLPHPGHVPAVNAGVERRSRQVPTGEARSKGILVLPRGDATPAPARCLQKTLASPLQAPHLLASATASF